MGVINTFSNALGGVLNGTIASTTSSNTLNIDMLNQAPPGALIPFGSGIGFQPMPNAPLQQQFMDPKNQIKMLEKQLEELKKCHGSEHPDSPTSLEEAIDKATDMMRSV